MNRRMMTREGIRPPGWEIEDPGRPGSANRHSGAKASRGGKSLYSLDLRALARVAVGSGPTFALVLIYVFFEYVRPQIIYPEIDIIPWTQITLILATVSLLISGRVVRDLFLLDYLLAGFAAIVIASSFSAYRPAASFRELDELFLVWVLVYWLVSTSVTNEKRFLVFLLAYFLWNLKMSQHASRTFLALGGGFSSWGATGAPGWFRNSGEMAIEMCIFLPMSWYAWVGLKDHLSRWKSYAILALPISAVIAIMASSSRGGQLGGAAVILALVLKSKRVVRGLIVGVFFGIFAFLLLPQEQRERFSEMGEDETSTTRMTYWSDALEIMDDYPWLGIGYRNWVPYYRNFYGAEGELPHNVFLEAGAELGYSGLAALIGLIIGTFITNLRTRRLANGLPGPSRVFLSSMAHGLDVALIGFMVSGFFVTVLYYPFLWMNLAFTSALFLVTRRRAVAPQRLVGIRKAQ